MFDPLNLAFLLVGRALGISLFFLYHFQFIVKYMISMAGLYLLLRRLTKSPAACLLAVTLVSISALLFFNDASYMAFSWIPFVLYFLTRSLESGTLGDLGWTAYFTGLYVGAGNYHIAEGTFYLLCFGAGTFAWNRGQWRVLLGRMKERKLATALAVAGLLATSLPVLATYSAVSREYHPIGRTALQRDLFERPDNYHPTYAQLMAEGSSMPAKGLVTWLAGGGLPFVTPIPVIVLALTAFGLIFGHNSWKQHLFVTTLISIFLTLGPRTPLYHIFWELYWPLRVVRQTYAFYIFVLAGLAYFTALGLEELRRRWKNRGRIIEEAALATAVVAATVAAIWGFFPKGENRKDYHADFARRAEAWAMPGPRIFAIPRTAYYLLEPILYNSNTALQMIVNPPQGKRPEDLPYWRAWDAMAGAAPNRCGATLGLRTFFWTKNYYQAYRLGENNLKLFDLLMGVGMPPVDFKPMATTTRDPWGFIRAKGYSQLKTFFKRHALIEVLEGNKPPALAETPSKGPVRFTWKVLSYRPDDVRLSAESDRAGVLVFRDGYSKDWAAMVDGRRTGLYNADAMFKGVPLPAGEHTVEFIYSPWLYIGAIRLYLALCLLLPALALIGRFRSRLA